MAPRARRRSGNPGREWRGEKSGAVVEERLRLPRTPSIPASAEEEKRGGGFFWSLHVLFSLARYTFLGQARTWGSHNEPPADWSGLDGGRGPGPACNIAVISIRRMQSMMKRKKKKSCTRRSSFVGVATPGGMLYTSVPNIAARSTVDGLPEGPRITRVRSFTSLGHIRQQSSFARAGRRWRGTAKSGC